jgi:hypothetical protein
MADKVVAVCAPEGVRAVTDSNYKSVGGDVTNVT